MRIISWNLLRRVGAGVEDLAALVVRYQPDVLLMQEATEEMAALPTIVGGHFFREPMHGRVYGLAVWSPHLFPPPYALPLPVSVMPGRVPPRVAQIIRIGDITLANVHLSHGQFLNRWQLFHIVQSLGGPAAIVGDFNAVGPIKLAGFKDIGPRQATHMASRLISFRLDRCMARGMRCTNAEVLQRGPSDHHPIVLDLSVVAADMHAAKDYSGTLAGVRRALPHARAGNWLRTLSRSPARIRISDAIARSLKSRGTKRKVTRGKHLAPADDVSAGTQIVAAETRSPDIR
ncbi:MAG: endonuclease/exonuclease/phosphatase family protein [Rhizomicrobium sp.]